MKLAIKKHQHLTVSSQKLFDDMANTAPTLACAWSSTTTTTNARGGDVIRTNSQGCVYYLHHMKYLSFRKVQVALSAQWMG
jgi:hypothetical protein